jgi:hypothetical protein
MKSHARVAVIGAGVVGCSALGPGHLKLDASLAGIGIQNVLEHLGPADPDDHHCCLPSCLTRRFGGLVLRQE